MAVAGIFRLRAETAMIARLMRSVANTVAWPALPRPTLVILNVVILPNWVFQPRQMWQVSVGGQVIVPYAESVRRAVEAGPISPMVYVLLSLVAVSLAWGEWVRPAIRRCGIPL
jgi:hypothetical protein